ncbi:MAG: DUF1800 domain-containing protein [Pegethrix bostrychoides GSE-TBD4-15B]|uniref:DUF1800 domain-containing protein n=1 Tax=Pegethrix bostrychoides GSE-TBD4-15B TaxID=2839662 RepID=A0A951U3E8_9CYAN|nr:DUF1800 domain-containing protein [Pegethrix bostrychoides GSE-TBD4-15B]
MPASAKAQHLLNRLSFGAKPGDLEQVNTMGIEAYIQQQLDPSLAEPSLLTAKLEPLETLHLTPYQLLLDYSPSLQIRQFRQQGLGSISQEQLNAVNAKAQVVLQQATQAKLWRAIDSPHQLQEVMVDFWYNHFNVFGHAGNSRIWVGAYEQQAIRPHVLGQFRDLLGATAHHPAMLDYLDNWLNTAPESPGARPPLNGLNENYARELMELHTLGVEGGYSQADVEALARILTGWSYCGIAIRESNREASNREIPDNGFCFAPRRHDLREKLFLGQKIPADGMAAGVAEGERALDILAEHPATAKFISYKLAQYFVADEPPAQLVNRLAQQFRATDGNILAVLQTLFKSPEFWDETVLNAKFKTPYQFAISAIRAADLEPSNLNPVLGLMRQLGMPVYGCETPDGYKNTEAAWLSPDAMLRRVNWATALASGRLLASPATAPANPADPSLSAAPVDGQKLLTTLGGSVSPKTRQVIANRRDPLRSALILGAPEFMYR